MRGRALAAGGRVSSSPAADSGLSVSHDSARDPGSGLNAAALYGGVGELEGRPALNTASRITSGLITGAFFLGFFFLLFFGTGGDGGSDVDAIGCRRWPLLSGGERAKRGPGWCVRNGASRSSGVTGAFFLPVQAGPADEAPPEVHAGLDMAR